MDLSTSVAGISMANPLMPASGPLTGDARKMIAVAAFGVGALATKTISAGPASAGRPSILARGDRVYNAELWSEKGPGEWAGSVLPAVRAAVSCPLFVSAGYSREDLEAVVPLMVPFADAFELSTHYAGRDPAAAAATVRAAVAAAAGKPVFLKLSPFAWDPADFARMALDSGAAGVVAVNSVGPALVLEPKSRRIALGNARGEAWLSGPAIKGLALAAVRRIKAEVPSCAVVGAGGVASAADVVDFLLAGADAVQMLSAAFLKGKDLFAAIIAGLPAALRERGLGSVEDARLARLEPFAPRKEPRPPAFDHGACTRCGLCVRVCPEFALRAAEDGRPEVDPDACAGCGLCGSRCPAGAIAFG